MKRVILIIAPLLFIGSVVFAVTPVKEMSIYYAGTASTVSVSTTTWTKVPAASSLSDRNAIKISNPITNAKPMVGVLVQYGVTPAYAITINPIEIEPGENPIIPISPNIDLYLLSTNSSAENVHAQEVRQ